MNTIKANTGYEIPSNYTGIVEFLSGSKWWYKNGKRHREDGPSFIYYNGEKEWWLDGKYIWNSSWDKLDLRNRIILSKEPHPLYVACQLFKYIDEYGIQEQIVIPGMEEWFIE